MKKVFFVLNGEKQVYFIEQPNAEKHADVNGGELFEEEIADKKFNELKNKKGFFSDLPVMKVKKNGQAEQPIKPDDLKGLVKKLQEENEQLKKVQNLSYQDAAELFKKKGELLSHIGKFETIQTKLENIELQPSDKDELSSDKYRFVLQGGYSYQKDEIFAVSNIYIISEFMEFVKTKVETKIETLKLEVQEL